MGSSAPGYEEHRAAIEQSQPTTAASPKHASKPEGRRPCRYARLLLRSLASEDPLVALPEDRTPVGVGCTEE